MSNDTNITEAEEASIIAELEKQFSINNTSRAHGPAYDQARQRAIKRMRKRMIKRKRRDTMTNIFARITARLSSLVETVAKKLKVLRARISAFLDRHPFIAGVLAGSAFCALLIAGYYVLLYAIIFTMIFAAMLGVGEIGLTAIFYGMLIVGGTAMIMGLFELFDPHIF